MYLKCFIVVFGLLECSAKVFGGDVYKAAVVEYSPIISGKPPINIEEILKVSVADYKQYIEEAGQKGVDIIVFPECGLTTIHIPASKAHIEPFTTEVPASEDHVVPCTDTGFNGSQALKTISCSARDNKIYVVINLSEKYNCEKDTKCPPDGVYYYNTNVVFDRKGTVIARYRKTHLFFEPGFSVRETPELITFETDFGVTFGTFVCFDILFKEPALTLVREKNIKSFVYTTAWFSESPFLTAAEVQAGWAYSNDVTLLAAGYDNPANKSCGSGIYMGKDGSLVDYMPLSRNNRLIIKDVPKDLKRNKQKFSNKSKVDETIEFTMFTDDFSNYSSEIVDFKNQLSIKNQLCHNELCCSFDIGIETAASDDEYVYRIVVFDGVRKYIRLQAGIQVCAVIPCLNKKIETCGSINITKTTPGVTFTKISIGGNFRNNEDMFHFPVTLKYNILPLDAPSYTYSTSTDDENIKMSLRENTNELLTFGVYGRDFSLDDGHNDIIGIPVRIKKTDNLMHHKFCLLDCDTPDGILMTGSLNWTLQALAGNWDNLMFTSQPELVSQFKTEFEKIWNTFIDSSDVSDI